MSLQNLKVQSYILFNPENVMMETAYGVTLQLRTQIDGSELWAVYAGSTVLDKTINEFVFEPKPSSRDEQFLKDCRFNTAQEAYSFWIEHQEKKYKEKISKYMLKR